ncbi:MAG: T9SS type A sorting domain-containing protein [Cyclobacteriaceae bacterium]
MKIFIIICTSILILTGPLSIATTKHISPEITTLTTEDLLVLRATRKFKGAEIEVFSSSGYLVTSGKLNKRKMIIDFKNVRSGSYLIRVKKGNTKKEFSFRKE